jgi:hypothetical protein
MTDDQRRRLTEYLGECWHEPCGPYTPGIMCSCGKRSYNAKHAENNRTFTNWPDLGAVKEKLVEKGDWFRRFKSYAASKWLDDEDEMERYEISDVAAFMVWLFRPIDENGKPHFCRLVAEWLESRKC